MNSTDYEIIFKAFGSVIALNNYFNLDASLVIEDGLVIMSMENSYLYSQVKYSMPNVKKCVDSYNSLLTALNSGLLSTTASLIRYTLKDLLESIEATDAGILNDLISDMTSESQTVLTGGLFYTYFYNTYGVELPNVGSGETIDESWAEYAQYPY